MSICVKVHVREQRVNDDSASRCCLWIMCRHIVGCCSVWCNTIYDTEFMCATRQHWLGYRAVCLRLHISMLLVALRWQLAPCH
jgi:hypothetical protein